MMLSMHKHETVIVDPTSQIFIVKCTYFLTLSSAFSHILFSTFHRIIRSTRFHKYVHACLKSSID